MGRAGCSEIKQPKHFGEFVIIMMHAFRPSFLLSKLTGILSSPKNEEDEDEENAKNLDQKKEQQRRRSSSWRVSTPSPAPGHVMRLQEYLRGADGEDDESNDSEDYNDDDDSEDVISPPLEQICLTGKSVAEDDDCSGFDEEEEEDSEDSDSEDDDSDADSDYV